MEYFEANDLGLIYLIYKNNIKNAKTYLSVSGCYEYLLISCKAIRRSSLNKKISLTACQNFKPREPVIGQRTAHAILELGEYFWFTEIITNPLSYVIRRCVKI